jgi:hypothetical protein
MSFARVCGTPPGAYRSNPWPHKNLRGAAQSATMQNPMKGGIGAVMHQHFSMERCKTLRY